jgi:hypothetical protein
MDFVLFKNYIEKHECEPVQFHECGGKYCICMKHDDNRPIRIKLPPTSNPVIKKLIFNERKNRNFNTMRNMFVKYDIFDEYCVMSKKQKRILNHFIRELLEELEYINSEYTTNVSINNLSKSPLNMSNHI